ncbi:MAG: MOSC domain-containing protein [Rhodospirillaceae bacterium]|nr:MOSC domain-containing protein [Rhodospirillaceae bacterium]
MTITLREIKRYPVKGLRGETLDAVALTPGQPLPHDRRFALAHASSGFDRTNGGWMPKNHFLNLSRDEKIAQLSVSFEPARNQLTLSRGGRQVASGNTETPVGRMMLDQIFAGFTPAGARGNPKLVEAGDTAFADVPEPYVSILSTASLTEIERVARRSIQIQRFRGNLVVDGAERWEERDWPGRKLRIGDTELQVEEPIARCAATNVDPESAARDMNIPLLLERGFGHTEFGAYARVLKGGTIRPGDTIEF